MVPMMSVVTVAAVSIVGPVVGVAIVRPVIRTVRIVVPIRVISPIVARSEANAEEHLSVGTWRRNKG